MLPTLRPEQVFARSCGEYTAHLGDRQAAAFTALWRLHDDPEGNAEAAARHLHAALGAYGVDGPVTIAPALLLIELHAGVQEVEAMYATRAASAMDVEYIALFSIIAGWSHEMVGANIDAFVLDVHA